jgi:hypothetical protein
MLTIPGHKGNAKSKSHQDSTSLLLELLPSSIPITTNVGENVGKKEPSYTDGGNVSSYNYYGKQYRGFLKNKHRSALWSSNNTPKDIPEGMQLRLSQRHLHTHVYCSTIHNSQAMETAKMLYY